MVDCLICKSKFDTPRGLSYHISQTHKMKLQEYYDKYFKKDTDGFCENCGKPTKFISIWKGYANCCCIKCAMPGRAKRNIEKYGYATNFNNPEINKKAHSKEADKKREQTMLNRYGAKSYLGTEKVKQQTIEYNQKHYGVNHYTQTDEYKEKTKQTNLDKYGVEYTFQRPDIIEKNKQSINTEEAKRKARETTREHYGVDNILQLKEVQEKAQRNSHTKEALSKRTKSRTPKINEISYKSEQTKRRKGNYSTYEKLFEQLCDEQNIDYTDNYYLDERYPYLCDFYLPKYDCFVEIFGGWFHNNHIYGTEPNDDKILAEWKKKYETNKNYSHAINTWSVKDVEKVECAKHNKLNFHILWSKEDIHKFFNNKQYIKKGK